MLRKTLRRVLMVFVVLALMTTSLAYAKTDNPNAKGQDKEQHQEQHTHKYEKHITKFTEIDGERIKVHGKHVGFDVPPVIKEGRTLIPVRAITEALGGTVDWNSEDYIVTITSPDGLIKIEFFLKDLYEDKNDNDVFDEGDLMVTPGGTIIIYDKDGDDWVQREELGRTDVLPGLINNRTFVPLRFIAETFGLKVGYDPDTGDIDIDDPDEDPDEDPEVVEPSLDPTKITYETLEAIDGTTDISVITAGFELDEIVDLELGTHYTTSTVAVADVTTEASLFIHLLETYVESLTAVEIELTVKMSKDTDLFEEEVTIVLDYNDVEPAIAPEEVLFKGDDIQVTLTPNGFTLDSITVDDVEVDYVGPIGDVVEFDGSDVSALVPEGDTVDFVFNFSKDTLEKSVTLSVEAYDYVPKLDPESVTYETLEAIVGTTDVDVETDGFAFVEILDAEDAALLNPEDYTLVDVLPESFTIQFTEIYVESLTDEVNAFEVKFVKGVGDDAEEVSLTFTIVLDYKHLEPTVTPTAADFDGVTDLEFDVVLNDYTLDDIKYGAESATYDFDDTTGVVEITDLYLNSIITDAAVTLDFEFSLGDDKAVTIPVVITPTSEE